MLDHDAAKAELKKLMPEDAKEAIGHGVRAKRSKSGAISFDLHASGGRPCSAPVKRSARSRRARQGAGRARKSGEVADRDHPLPVPTRGRPELSLRLARPAGSIWCASASASMRSPPCRPPRSTSDSGPDPAHHDAGAFLRRMGVLGLAGLSGQRDRGAASDGSRAHLCPTLCAVHAGRDCRRGRSRCTRSKRRGLGSPTATVRCRQGPADIAPLRDRARTREAAALILERRSARKSPRQRACRRRLPIALRNQLISELEQFKQPGGSHRMGASGPPAQKPTLHH